MLFEGTEKKVEIIFSKEVNIKKKLQPLWKDILNLANIKILSSISNKNIEAYLLSESSLFVWDHRILIITCGQSKLISSIEYILKNIDKKNIEFLIYERKNEYLPLEQKTSFKEDVATLNKYDNGEAFLLGELDEHHMLMYYLNKNYTSSSTDQTTQILISGLSLKTMKFFSTCKNKKDIQKLLNLPSFFSDYLINDYIFSPSGYSINAIKDDFYYTLHITPQKPVSYVSFETNMALADEAKLVKHFVNIFKPRSLDCISYLPQNVQKPIINLQEQSYVSRNTFSKNISKAYKAVFTSYISNHSEQKEAQCLKI
ncbi:MAG: adenosylmethionine decarboxylase [Bdellovibrionaceae bacterium]|nr:adenosylmethionine decarboxylase [Pseudobdellovibrionaceae bacterium]